MKIVSEIRNDIIKYLKGIIAELGYNIKGISNEEIFLIFSQIYCFLIPKKSRVIFKSKSFFCPPHYEKNLTELEEDISNGENLNRYQSKRNLSQFKDAMLYDWGVRHFHLGGKGNIGEKFSSRTGELLFVLVKDDAIYLIGVYNHKSWSKTEIIEVIHENWPFLLEQSKNQFFSSINWTPTEGDIPGLRKCALNYTIQTKDGTSYTSLGGGILPCGNSMKVSAYLSALNDWIASLENNVKEQSNSLIADAQKAGIETDLTIHCLFSDNDDNFQIRAYNKEKNISTMLCHGEFFFTSKEYI